MLKLETQPTLDGKGGNFPYFAVSNRLKGDCQHSAADIPCHTACGPAVGWEYFEIVLAFNNMKCTQAVSMLQGGEGI